MDTPRIPTKKIVEALDTIRLEPDSLLIVREGSELSKGTTINNLQAAIEKLGIRNVVLLVAKSTADIGRIPESQLNEAGWYHITTIAEKVEKYNTEK